MTEGFIYLIREREFIKTNENIFKIGKSKQEFGKRFNQYPNQSQMYLHLYINDVDTFEKLMIELFSKEFNRRIDIGYEYFEGNIDDMTKVIFNCYFNDNFNKINEINIELQNKINEFISTKEKEKTSDIEKINLKLEKQKIKEEKLIKDKAKLEQFKKVKTEKQILQKTAEEKNKQEKIKRKLFDEIKEKMSSIIVNRYFYAPEFKLQRCKSLKEINSFTNEYIKKRYEEIHEHINNIYDIEIISKIKIKNVKKMLMLKMCRQYNGIIPEELIRQVREQYYNKEDIVKMEKMDIMYSIYYEMRNKKAYLLDLYNNDDEL